MLQGENTAFGRLGFSFNWDVDLPTVEVKLRPNITKGKAAE